MFLPTTSAECDALGWPELDVILVTGDAYIDSPLMGVAVIGKVLVAEGFRVGIIAQPDLSSALDIQRLGKPRLFWGVTGGSVDSMVANITAAGKPRRSDDFTPGGKNDRRPNRAVIAYSNLIRRHVKNTVPIVLGGIEASLRRISHYDVWENRIRRSVLFDAKADYLIYGMGETTVVQLAQRLAHRQPVDELNGLCYASSAPPKGYVVLPTHGTVAEAPRQFIDMFHQFYGNTDPVTARGLVQLQDTRYLVQNPPQPPLSTAQMDAVHALDWENAVHPSHADQGAVSAIETIRFSIATHRGCYGECHFCAIAVHQGRTVHWRSPDSILDEARLMIARPDFKGRIHDVGGPTANMYGFECDRKSTKGACRHRRCLFPTVCDRLPVSHGPQRDLLKRLRALPGVRQVVVASGLRTDLIMADTRDGDGYLSELAAHHVSGQLKVAPEHSVDNVLTLMGKNSSDQLIAFKEKFDRFSAASGKRQFLTYYLMAAHPGCTQSDMAALGRFCRDRLNVRNPEQVQVFTPTPSTYATLMYATGCDPFTGAPIFVEKDPVKRQQQKGAVTGETPRHGSKDRRKKPSHRY
ncbi:MAG: YgiQ family radical SAM protein [Pseudomonadota bacterium]